jgi:hypothetical protein
MGPFEPLKFYFEENLTVSHGFDDASYLPRIALYSGFVKRRTRKLIRRKAKGMVKKQQPVVQAQLKKPTKTCITHPFVCGVCVCEGIGDFQGRSLTQLTQHLAQEHHIYYNTEHQQTCSECNKNYRSRSSFLKHAANMHPLLLEQMKQTLQGRMHIDVLELMLARVEQGQPVIVEPQPAEFTSSDEDQDLLGGLGIKALEDSLRREEQRVSSISLLYAKQKTSENDAENEYNA